MWLQRIKWQNDGGQKQNIASIVHHMHDEPTVWMMADVHYHKPPTCHLLIHLLFQAEKKKFCSIPSNWNFWQHLMILYYTLHSYICSACCVVIIHTEWQNTGTPYCVCISSYSVYYKMEHCILYYLICRPPDIYSGSMQDRSRGANAR